MKKEIERFYDSGMKEAEIARKMKSNRQDFEEEPAENMDCRVRIWRVETLKNKFDSFEAQFMRLYEKCQEGNIPTRMDEMDFADVKPAFEIIRNAIANLYATDGEQGNKCVEEWLAQERNGDDMKTLESEEFQKYLDDAYGKGTVLTCDLDCNSIFGRGKFHREGYTINRLGLETTYKFLGTEKADFPGDSGCTYDVWKEINE